jgi:predicted secreted hydrolase
MKSRLRVILGLLATLVNAADWQLAQPGYHFEFPRDYFNHPKYQTEWWYYTGNLQDSQGRHFGFELTFFRQGVELTRDAAESEDAVWRPDNLYLAHFAISDIEGRRFYHAERLNRAGPGLAGSNLNTGCYWNGNWRVTWANLNTAEQKLEAQAGEFGIVLDLKPEKPVVINGRESVSRKGPADGEASHYVSFTRMAATGSIERSGKNSNVSGLAWMDHEFFTELPDKNLRGWDWFAVQLDDNRELMLYRLRLHSGAESPYSSGTYVDETGHAHFLKADDFNLIPRHTWKSPGSGGTYPLEWQIEVPSLKLSLTERTALADQELFGKGSVSPAYWEGAVTYRGNVNGSAIQGVGYLEMTGYARPVQLRAAKQQ